MQEDRPLHALAYMLSAQFCFSSNILMVRLSERAERLWQGPSYHLPPWEAMFARSILLTFWCLFFLWIKRPRKLDSREQLWLWARGIAGVMSLSAYYYGVLHIPLGMASLFSNSSPLYVTVLATSLAGERLAKGGLLALIGGFVGVGLVGLGGFHGLSEVEPRSLLIAGLSGPLSALAYFSIRQLKDIHPAQIMLSLGLGGTILASIMILLQGEHFPRSTEAVLWLGLSAIPAIAAQECLTRAFRKAPAAQVAPLQYTGPLFSTLLAALFLQEGMPMLALLGIATVLIFGCFLPYGIALRSSTSKSS